jgi:hypothetical protein
LRLWGSNEANIVSGDNWSKNFNKNNEYNIGDNTIIEVEVDIEKKVIFYFINKKQCPYYISDVSSSLLLFGINAGVSKAILEVLSVKKIVKSSSDPSVPCEAAKWVKEEEELYILEEEEEEKEELYILEVEEEEEEEEESII